MRDFRQQLGGVKIGGGFLATGPLDIGIDQIRASPEAVTVRTCHATRPRHPILQRRVEVQREVTHLVR